jgi:preprotein translocase subunit SecB
MQVNISYNISNSLNPEKTRLATIVGAEIKSIDESFSLACKMVGLFSVISGHENMDIEQFGQTNAPALIFPYLREMISSITTKAGFAALILPPINLSVIMQQNNKQLANASGKE